VRAYRCGNARRPRGGGPIPHAHTAKTAEQVREELASIFGGGAIEPAAVAATALGVAATTDWTDRTDRPFSAVRLDPKLGYFAELAARKQRRTVSSFIERAIERALSAVELSDFFESPSAAVPSVADKMYELWDLDEAERFVKLAFSYPEMLRHEEQVLWKLIRENGALWKGVLR
jgi:hypothetical protein